MTCEDSYRPENARAPACALQVAATLGVEPGLFRTTRFSRAVSLHSDLRSQLRCVGGSNPFQCRDRAPAIPTASRIKTGRSGRSRTCSNSDFGDRSATSASLLLRYGGLVLPQDLGANLAQPGISRLEALASPAALNYLSNTVPAAGLEPAEGVTPRFLRPLCMPFHHAGKTGGSDCVLCASYVTTGSTPVSPGCRALRFSPSFGRAHLGHPGLYTTGCESSPRQESDLLSLLTKEACLQDHEGEPLCNARGVQRDRVRGFAPRTWESAHGNSGRSIVSYLLRYYVHRRLHDLVVEESLGPAMQNNHRLHTDVLARRLAPAYEPGPFSSRRMSTPARVEAGLFDNGHRTEHYVARPCRHNYGRSMCRDDPVLCW